MEATSAVANASLRWKIIELASQPAAQKTVEIPDTVAIASESAIEYLSANNCRTLHDTISLERVIETHGYNHSNAEIVVRRADRLFAVRLYERGVSLTTVENALTLAAARRSVRLADAAPLTAIRRWCISDQESCSCAKTRVRNEIVLSTLQILPRRADKTCRTVAYEWDSTGRRRRFAGSAIVAGDWW
jgi:hypothetical protein